MSIDRTAEKITLAAIHVLLNRGVKRSSLADVAYEAGVTRITVYRHFGDKRGLVRAVCRRAGAIFQRAAAGDPKDNVAEINERLKRLGTELSHLPQGSLLARFEEIRRLYPECYEEFLAARQDALDRLFQQAVAAAGREHALRDGINLAVVKAMFWTSVVGLIENPSLIASNVPLTEICATVTEVFRHGMLKVEGARAEI
ncbi:MAG: TetR/AcrR family transcriptional regulator [Thermoguttaceae bacterium]